MEVLAALAGDCPGRSIERHEGSSPVCGTTLPDSKQWDALHDRFPTVGRIDHGDAYSTDEANTDQAESYFSRLRRMVEGQHHHVSARYLYQYAAEAAWKEDDRRLSNGVAFRRTLSLSPVSRQWKGLLGAERGVMDGISGTPSARGHLLMTGRDHHLQIRH